MNFNKGPHAHACTRTTLRGAQEKISQSLFYCSLTYNINYININEYCCWYNCYIFVRHKWQDIKDVDVKSPKGDIKSPSHWNKNKKFQPDNFCFNKFQWFSEGQLMLNVKKKTYGFFAIHFQRLQRFKKPFVNLVGNAGQRSRDMCTAAVLLMTTANNGPMRN